MNDNKVGSEDMCGSPMTAPSCLKENTVYSEVMGHGRTTTQWSKKTETAHITITDTPAGVEWWVAFPGNCASGSVAGTARTREDAERLVTAIAGAVLGDSPNEQFDCFDDRMFGYNRIYMMDPFGTCTQWILRTERFRIDGEERSWEVVFRGEVYGVVRIESANMADAQKEALQVVAAVLEMTEAELEDYVASETDWEPYEMEDEMEEGDEKEPEVEVC